MRNFICLSECRSAIACNTFGYCRERNKDGMPVNATENTRRKAESDEAYDAQGDFAESLKVGYAAIRERETAKPESLRNYDFAKRERMTAGGPSQEPKA